MFTIKLDIYISKEPALLIFMPCNLRYIADHGPRQKGCFSLFACMLDEEVQRVTDEIKAQVKIMEKYVKTEKAILRFQIDKLRRI